MLYSARIARISNIETKYTGKTAFLHLGFRPFFFAAISYGVVLIVLWFFMYSQGKAMLPNGYNIISWHAHEMIFGFAMATITGFLLTAVKNWTGIQTIDQKPLLGLFLLWLVSRGLAFVSGNWVLHTLAVMDSLYLLVVIWAFSLALHAFSYGGVGLISSGMMARVSLGHTGNNVFEPPKILHLIFALLFIGAVVRVILPLFLSSYYLQLMTASQILWIISFGILFIKYAPMLIKARIDGRYG